jgi:hypothetical protein
MKTHLRLAGLMLSVAALLSACGGGSSQSSPSSPTPASGAAAGANGTVPVPTPPMPDSANAMGTVSDLGGTCPTLSFKLDAKAVTTDAATVFEGGACADVKNGVRAGAMGRIQRDGSILAARVRIAPGMPPPTPQPRPGAAMGTVSDLGGACPALSFKIDNKAVRTDAATVFDGGGCADVKNGVRAGAMGRIQSDGSILAAHVRIAPATPPRPPQPPPMPGVVGPISALTGTCPNLSMTVATRAVTTNNSTVFEGKACGDLRNGDRVGVLGSVAPGGTAIVAQKVMSRR